MKKGILIPILILIFLTLSCASASDLNGTLEDVTLTNANDDSIGENSLNDTLSVSNEENLAVTVYFDGTTFSQLQSKINSAHDYDTIVLTKNVKQDGSSPIHIEKPITIDGNGFTIDGNMGGRMITIEGGGANVTLKNISFINGYDHDFSFGVGAIYWNAPNALLTHCNFTNIDGGHVGCVDWEGINGTISYCNFKDCKGGYSNVRVVETASNTTIDHCTFDNCTDEMRAGAIEWFAVNGLLNNTRVINCRGPVSVIYWTASKGKINNCSFIGNTYNQWGVIYWPGGSGVLNNSNFINNWGPSSSSTNYKGILAWKSGNGIISNCNFINSTTGTYGGAISISDCGNVTIVNSTFTNNKGLGGGAIYSPIDGINVVNCTFEKNQASIGGAIYSTDHKMIISNSTFNGNVATESGGAIHASVCDNKYINCTFIGNAAKSSNGGAIGYFYGSGAIEGCRFINNSARSGGALALQSNNEFPITNSSFEDNTAVDNGGAVYLVNAAIVTDSNFTNNSATNGGAFFANSEDKILKINNSSFNRNVASFRGGALFAKKGTSVNYTQFEDNAAQNGSAIYLTKAGNNISNSVFLNNRANSTLLDCVAGFSGLSITFSGGNNYLNAVYSNEEISISNITYYNDGINNSDIIIPCYNTNPGQNITLEIYRDNNLVCNMTLKTGNDGKLFFSYNNIECGNYTYKVYHSEDSYYTYIEKRDNFKFGEFDLLQTIINDASENSTINLTRNYTYSVGLDTITDGIQINKRNLTINGNGYTINALGQSRIFHVLKENVALKNTSFINGNVSGAIFIEGNAANFEIDNCKFENNVNNDGGAIKLYAANSTIKNSYFKNNGADFGGAIYMDSENILISNCNFEKNAQRAIYGVGNHNTIENCNFINNSAKTYGGAIDLRGTHSTIRNCNFTGNNALNGGAVHIDSENSTIVNCSFKDNNASNGGAIDFMGNYYTIKDCNFTGNHANTGGAIQFSGNEGYYVDRCSFINNSADYQGGAIKSFAQSLTISNSVFLKNKAPTSSMAVRMDEIGQLIITFEGKNNYINAIYSSLDPEMINVTYWNGEIVNSDDVKPIRSNFPGVKITLEVFNHEGSLADNATLTVGSDNKVYYDTGKLGDDTYYIKAHHFEDDYYTYFMCDINITISRAPSQVNINITDKQEFYYGDCNISFNISNRTVARVVITNSGGSVVYNKTIDKNYIVVNLDANDEYYNITVYNLVNANYSASQDSKLFKILKLISHVNITSIGDVIYGNKTVIEFNVTNRVQVNATVYDENKSIVFTQIVSGNTVEVPVMSVGQYNITIINMDDRNVWGSKNSTLFNVIKANSTIIISPIVDADYGDAIEATFDGDNITYINVTVYDKDEGIVFNEIVSANNLTLPILPVGKYNMTVINLGDENHTASKNSTVFNINPKVNNVKVIVDDVSYPNEAIVIIEADFDGIYKIDVNGTVQTVNVANGRGNASFKLSSGDYYANATFDNPNYNSFIANDTFSVFKNGEYPMNVTVDAIEGENATVTVKLPDDATGNVTVSLSDKNYTVPVSNGEAIITLPTLSAGNVTANVTYSGNQNYSKKESEISIHVKKVTLIAYDVKYGWSDSITYQAKLIDEKGNGIPNKQITFLIGGKTYNATTNSQGIAYISLSLNVGSYNVEISIPTENITKKISVIARLTENKNLVMDYLSGSKYKVRAIDDNGNPVGSGTVVKIKVNGVTYNLKTDNKGYAMISLKFKPNTYTVTSTYKGFTVKNTIKIKSTLKAKKMFKVKKTAKRLFLKAKLKWSNGKPIVGKKITFKFKNKIYKAKTNKKGIAKVKVKKKVIKKLKKGKKYKVKISYKNEKVMSKVKVRK